MVTTAVSGAMFEEELGREVAVGEVPEPGVAVMSEPPDPPHATESSSIADTKSTIYHRLAGDFMTPDL
jgi:hypothetical protein